MDDFERENNMNTSVDVTVNQQSVRTVPEAERISRSGWK
jgi:hypothetical protein